ncbi:ATP cone domain-containing protein [Opitutus terrae]|uniref:ATP-cone domain protein n=1 Tax=Opitutus terrae (strain DSM 11246 / JCM 15787 / PB90-1) TaxID=452637 RepID=B1ZWW1_OPITP|nr:ATP cone domain-containing protein [Opitutus terrae]ACB75072.1 ATP-cone domain protein [Opitutus terrae PB90-1]
MNSATLTAPSQNRLNGDHPVARKGAQLLNRAIPADARMVIKRDGSKVRFDQSKVTRALALAFHEVRTDNAPNPYRDHLLACFGLDTETFNEVSRISGAVAQMLELYYRDGKHPSIEQVQDAAEKAIAAAGHWEVARAYMLYRARHAERRLAHYVDNGMADYIAMAKYARYRPDLGRREIFTEGVERVRDMHLTFFADKLERQLSSALPAEITDLAGKNAELLVRSIGGMRLDQIIADAFTQVATKKVLPSMRSMQFGGPAILKNHSRIFNCSFANVDRIEFFREYFFLLLSGCGVGFSVQKHHIAMLPPLPPRGAENDLPVVHFHIEDTIEGWSDALHALIMSFYEGTKIEFDYSRIRPRGSLLKTSGGKAPGHLPLKKALGKVEALLHEAAGRALRPIEVYDLNMFIAKAVLAGGIRRSATICLFSPDDEEMMNAKTGNWFDKHPHRSASNNSAVLSRSDKNIEHFKKLFKAQKEFGEPGFFFNDHPDAGCNPCAEINLLPVVNWELSQDEVAKLFANGYKGDLPGTTRLSGFQHCNLTTINGQAATTETAFYKACIAATVIGTLQAAYTDMPYLGPITKLINEHDSLLGVSICGFMDNPGVLFDQEILTSGAKLCRATNRLVAKLIGIQPAAKLSTCKPEGTASLILGAASGIHPHHARRYFRRVQANRKEPIYAFFKQTNPQMTEVSVYNPDTDDVITFPVEAPKKAILRKDLTAIQFLELVKLVQQSWVIPGGDPESRSPDLHHNVSNTCTVRADEWEEVAEFIWANRRYFTGISLLQEAGDKTYAQAPREEVSTEADVAKWNSLRPNKVDYTLMREQSDETELKQTVACAGGACELI